MYEPRPDQISSPFTYSIVIASWPTSTDEWERHSLDGATVVNDVTTVAGDRIQVKARIMAGNGGKFSQFRSFDFTSAIFLTFDPSTLDIAYARELTSEEVTGHGSKSGWTNATTLTGGRVKALGTDVTDEMRDAYVRLDGEDPI